MDALVSAWNRNVMPWWLPLPQGSRRDLLWRASQRSITDSVRNALAVGRGDASQALPVIGAGSGGVVEAQALAWLEDTLRACDAACDVCMVRHRSPP